MKIYKTEEGFLWCSEAHSRHFERNYDFLDSRTIVQANLLYTKGEKAYESLPKKVILETIKQTIKEYKRQLIKLREIEKWVGKDE